MPTVDFGACLSNYWFVWTIDGLGSVFGLLINMAISYFFLKYFHNIASGSPTATQPTSDFSNVDSSSPVNDMPSGSWANDATAGNAFAVASV